MALPPSNAFSSARLDRPDRALRKIAIKQMAGQPLNNRELTRLASRQGVEMRYAENGNKNFGSIASAYEAAGAPLAIRNRLATAGSALGRISAEYGENSLQGVQQLNRDRLLRERELGNIGVERNKLALGDDKLRSGYLPKQLERQDELSNIQLADARMRSEYLPRDLSNKDEQAKLNLDKARFENSIAPERFKTEQAANEARIAATKSLIDNRQVRTLKNIDAMSQEERDRDALAIIAKARTSGGMTAEDFARLRELSPALAAAYAKESNVQQFDYEGGDGKMKRATFVNGKQVREAGNGSSKMQDKSDKLIKDAVSGAGANAENPDAKKTPQQKFWRM